MSPRKHRRRLIDPGWRCRYYYAGRMCGLVRRPRAAS